MNKEPVDYLTSVMDVIRRLGAALGYKDSELVFVPLLNEAAECIEALSKQEPFFAFRHKGLEDFCTCSKERFDELSQKPNLFEVRTFYAAPVVPAQGDR